MLDPFGKFSTRRLMKVEVPAEVILETLRIGKRGRTIDGVKVVCDQDAIPQTAKIVGTCLCETSENRIAIIIEDESFNQINSGMNIPILEPRYSRVDPGMLVSFDRL